MRMTCFFREMAIRREVTGQSPISALSEASPPQHFRMVGGNGMCGHTHTVFLCCDVCSITSPNGMCVYECVRVREREGEKERERV